MRHRGDLRSFDARCYAEQEGCRQGCGVTLAALTVSGSFCPFTNTATSPLYLKVCCWHQDVKKPCLKII